MVVCAGRGRGVEGGAARATRRVPALPRHRWQRGRRRAGRSTRSWGWCCVLQPRRVASPGMPAKKERAKEAKAGKRERKQSEKASRDFNWQLGMGVTGGVIAV